MIFRPASAISFFAVFVLCLLAPAVQADPQTVAEQPADTTKIEPPPASADSVLEKTRREVAKIQEWLHQTEADSADTVQPERPHFEAPTLKPLPGANVTDYSFGEFAGEPHTAFSDHLLWIPEIQAPATTEYGTERQFSYRGLVPLGAYYVPDGVAFDLRRPTFPQTLLPDLMAAPPYLFSSIHHYPGSYPGTAGEVLATQIADSIHQIPFSDFFVRRGDYGLSLTQGRLYRPLPGGRTVNIGFSIAQSDGRGLNDAGRNRNLYAQLISPLRGPYNLSATWYQYTGKPDIQTAQDFWRYHFVRDDLSWRFDAVLFRGDTLRSPVYVRFVYDHNKYIIRTQSPEDYAALYGEYALYEKRSRTSLAAVYAPRDPDSTGNQRAGITISFYRFHDRSEHFNRPEYTAWVEKSWRPVAGQTLFLSAMLNGNDDDPPAPLAAANWLLTPGGQIALTLSLQRQRVIPDIMDRNWLPHTATFVGLDDRIVSYSESGNGKLDSWWSNSVAGKIEYGPGKRLSVALSGWASYEQDYYYWRDLDDDSLVMEYRPTATDARTTGVSVSAGLPAIGPFSTRAVYTYQQAEQIDGRRLPGYFDHRGVGAVDADLTVTKFNLELHGSTEFHYWRAPSSDYTAYNRRDVFRTDVLGAATIKDFTIYWLAQNIFNYGYRKAPGFNYLGSTIMWGLYLRFHN